MNVVTLGRKVDLRMRIQRMQALEIALNPSKVRWKFSRCALRSNAQTARAALQFDGDLATWQDAPLMRKDKRLLDFQSIEQSRSK
jgi:hypothetical protein